ncbi:MAG: CaiB/BaiF CoA transferase family protein [Candidatus Helarchaeota archaeon]
MVKLLEGIRVADLSQFFSGPWGSMLLSDQGAEVIKIEPPGFGEALRMFVFFDKDIAPLFTILNRNKKSITLNLRVKEGQDIFKKLIAECDVLLENFTPGTLVKWGLDYETVLKKINPKLIYASVSGFGQKGIERYCKKTAFDVIAQAVSGVLDTCQIKNAPRLPTADLSAGAYIALGISQALFYREKTGVGQAIDLSMHDMMYAMNVFAHSREFIKRAQEKDLDSPVFLPTYNQYPTRDGNRVAIVVVTPKQFKRFCNVMGQPKLYRDKRFKSPMDRMDNADELDEIVQRWTSQYNRDEIIEMLEAERIPCGPVIKREEIRDHPQLKARDMLITKFKFEGVPKATIPGVILKFSETPGSIDSKAADLGANNQDIYRDLLKFSEEDLENWKKNGII